MKEIFIVEDEIVVAKAIEQTLLHNGYAVSGIATSFNKAKEQLSTHKPDLILCDINLNGVKNGIELMQEIEWKFQVPLIFISAYDDIEILREADKLSPENYITKPFNEKQLLVSIDRVFEKKHEKDLQEPTTRELDILKLVARGHSSKMMAEKLNLSFHTIETHRKNLLKKYDVNSMAELICFVTDKGWVGYNKEL